jgi:hypothetical protein
MNNNSRKQKTLQISNNKQCPIIPSHQPNNSSLIVKVKLHSKRINLLGKNLYK